MLKKLWKKIRKGVCMANSFITGFGIGWFGAGAIITLNPTMAIAAVGCGIAWYINYQWAIRIDQEAFSAFLEEKVQNLQGIIPVYSHMA